MRTIDLTGKRFGKLTVLRRDTTRKSNGYIYYWICQCDCGTIKSIAGNHLRNGNTKSCGCLVTKHGMSGTPTYHSWNSMKNRCLNPSDPAYKNYGGRGITICDRWKNSFKNFYSDMGKCPKGCTLDRIDVDGNYNPDNCRWADIETQNNNKRNNRYITFNGETKTIAEWAREIGISIQVLFYRINKFHWPPEKALTTPVKKRRKNNEI